MTHFVWLNRGKESLAVDLKSNRGRRIARALIARADVFLHNTAPDVVERLGLDADTLRAADPRLVVVTISGHGTSGPRRDRKAYDMLIQAESGMVSVTGTPDTATKTRFRRVSVPHDLEIGDAAGARMSCENTSHCGAGGARTHDLTDCEALKDRVLSHLPAETFSLA
ncbi:CoA transferase [Pseudonocardia sp. NPDC049154]|uniref:CoA transferase n=1 Tax=Pseudonocardia sp. NPDC049154 TaxID=3155501 RepID=UPI0033F20245